VVEDRISAFNQDVDHFVADGVAAFNVFESNKSQKKKPYGSMDS
jgi:hypothetical protein